MNALEASKARELCLELLYSDSEDQVIEVLKKRKFWDDPSCWKPCGNVQNNRGIVGNQQSSPVAALVEKIINSIDAVLMSECFKSGIDPTSKNAPKTMQDAFQQFFNVKDGRIENLTPTERT